MTVCLMGKTFLPPTTETIPLKTFLFFTSHLPDFSFLFFIVSLILSQEINAGNFSPCTMVQSVLAGSICYGPIVARKSGASSAFWGLAGDRWGGSRYIIQELHEWRLNLLSNTEKLLQLG